MAPRFRERFSNRSLSSVNLDNTQSPKSELCEIEPLDFEREVCNKLKEVISTVKEDAVNHNIIQ